MTNIPPPGQWPDPATPMASTPPPPTDPGFGAPTSGFPPPAGPAPARPSRSGRWPLVILSLLLVAFIAATAVFAALYLNASDDSTTDTAASSAQSEAAVAQKAVAEHEKRRAEALQVAEDVAIKIGSIDYGNIDTTTAAVTAMSTPAYAAKYKATVENLKKSSANTGIRATATVTASGIKDFDDHAATALVLLAQTTHVNAQPGTTSHFQLVIDLLSSGNRWLVDNIDFQ